MLVSHGKLLCGGAVLSENLLCAPQLTRFRTNASPTTSSSRFELASFLVLVLPHCSGERYGLVIINGFYYSLLSGLLLSI